MERVQRLTLITVSEQVKFLRDENARDICIMMIQSPPRTGVCELPSHLCWDWDTVVGRMADSLAWEVG